MQLHIIDNFGETVEPVSNLAQVRDTTPGWQKGVNFIFSAHTVSIYVILARYDRNSKEQHRGKLNCDGLSSHRCHPFPQNSLV